MLKMHQNVLASRPSERLRVGQCVVDLSLRQIMPEDGLGEATRVTVKSQGVLMVLIASAGQVVSRDTLLEWVWSDTTPNDDVINQAIGQLRKAFGDSRKPYAYIETISKRGYRLIAPIEWLLPTAEPPLVVHESVPIQAATDTEDSRQQSETIVSHDLPQATQNRGRLLAGLLAVVSLLVFAYWLLNETSGPRFESASSKPESLVPVAGVDGYQRIASLPEHERGPALSPDGAMLAYTRFSKDGKSAALMLQVASPLPAESLTAFVPDTYDTRPEWSPDGQQIVFVRIVGSRCLIMLIPATGGDEREAGPCIGKEPDAVSWYPDGKALIGAGQGTAGSAPAEASAIYRMPLDSGRWERVRYERSPADIDTLPQVSPDGRWIAFHRNASVGDLWRMPLAGGAPQRLTRMHFKADGLAWMPDSERLMFGRELHGKNVLSRLDIATGTVADFSVVGSHLSHPSIATRTGAIVFQVVDFRERILRLRLALGVSAFEKAQSQFESNGSNRLPALSPDNEQIVFVSSRTGRPMLWWMATAKPESLRPIDGFAPLLINPPSWNASSDKILAIGDGAKGRGVYEIEPSSGHVVPLDIPGRDAIQAIYHPDTSRLLVLGGSSEGRLGLSLFARSERGWRVLSKIDEDVAVAIVDHANRRILFGRRSKPEIWATDLALHDRRLVQRLDAQPRTRTMTPAVDGAWALDSSPDCAWHWRRIADGDSPQRKDDICLGHQAPLPLDSVVPYDVKRGEIYLSPREYDSYDIGYMPDTSAFGSPD
jgi:DNA-binding winged helix-turn-helix (wHTH) protein/Tol biopolymer transport system component